MNQLKVEIIYLFFSLRNGCHQIKVPKYQRLNSDKSVNKLQSFLCTLKRIF